MLKTFTAPEQDVFGLLKKTIEPYYSGVSTRSDTGHAVHPWKKDRGLKCQTWEVDKLSFLKLADRSKAVLLVWSPMLLVLVSVSVLFCLLCV